MNGNKRYYNGITESFKQTLIKMLSEEDKTPSGRQTGIGAGKTLMQPDKTWDEIAREEAGKSVAFKGKDLSGVKFERKDGKVYADGIELTTASTKTSHYAADAPTRAGMAPKPAEAPKEAPKPVAAAPTPAPEAPKEAPKPVAAPAPAPTAAPTPAPKVEAKPDDIVAASAKALEKTMPKVAIGPTSRQAAAETIAKNAAQDTDAARAEKIKAAEAKRERTSGSELGRMMQGQTTFEDPNTGKPVKFTPLEPSDIRTPAAGSATKPGSTVELGRVETGTFGVTPAGQAEIRRQAGGDFESWKAQQRARQEASMRKRLESQPNRPKY